MFTVCLYSGTYILPKIDPEGARESRAVDGILDKLTQRQYFVAGIGGVVLLGIPEPSPAIGRNDAGQRRREAVGGFDPIDPDTFSRLGL